MKESPMRRCSLSLAEKDAASLETVGLLMGYTDEFGVVNRSKSARFLISFGMRFLETLERVPVPKILDELDPGSACLYRLSVLADNYDKNQENRPLS